MSRKRKHQGDEEEVEAKIKLFVMIYSVDYNMRVEDNWHHRGRITEIEYHSTLSQVENKEDAPVMENIPGEQLQLPCLDYLKFDAATRKWTKDTDDVERHPTDRALQIAFMNEFHDLDGKMGIYSILRDKLSDEFDVFMEPRLPAASFIITPVGGLPSSSSEAAESSGSTYQPLSSHQASSSSMMDLRPQAESSSSQNSPVKKFFKRLKPDVVVSLPGSSGQQNLAVISIKRGPFIFAEHEGQLKCEMLVMLASAEKVVGAITTCGEAKVYEATRANKSVVIQVRKKFNFMDDIANFPAFINTILYLVKQNAPSSIAT